MKQTISALALTVCGLLAACDGPRENAGEKADAAVNASGVIQGGPQERLGEIQDRTAKDRAKAIEAQADAAEDRADEIKMSAGQRADALERQAKALRQQAKGQANALDQQADTIRGK
jgi:acyl-CoA reductase-like NAD-dependent aldehyde dehydrogenase